MASVLERTGESGRREFGIGRRRLLVGLGTISATVLAGCGGSQSSQLSTGETTESSSISGVPRNSQRGVTTTPLLDVLTKPVGTWIHYDALPPQAAISGGPVVQTILVWNFHLNEISRQSGFHGVGNRQSVIESPNGFIPQQSGVTGNVGGHYQWQLAEDGGDAGVLRVEYRGLGAVPGRPPNVETFRLTYHRERDSFGVQPLDNAWSAGEWIRLTEPTSGFDQPRVGAGEQQTRYTRYRTVADPNRMVQFEVPVEWSNVVTEPISNGSIVAASPPQVGQPVIPYVSVAVSTDPQVLQQPTALLQWQVQARQQQGCTTVHQQQFTNPSGLGGTSVLLAGCGGLASVSARIVLAVPPTRTSLVLVDMQLVGDRDNEAADRILQSLRVNV